MIIFASQFTLFTQKTIEIITVRHLLWFVDLLFWLLESENKKKYVTSGELQWSINSTIQSITNYSDNQLVEWFVSTKSNWSENISWYISFSMTVNWISLGSGHNETFEDITWALGNTDRHFSPFSDISITKQLICFSITQKYDWQIHWVKH